jgi:hypothetical protein
MRAYMLTIRDACRRPFATITIVMVANGRRQTLARHLETWEGKDATKNRAGRRADYQIFPLA